MTTHPNGADNAELRRELLEPRRGFHAGDCQNCDEDLKRRAAEALEAAERERDEARALLAELPDDRALIYANLSARAEAAESKVSDLERERESLRRQAEQWAMEARAHKSSLHEAYQAVTGATGEPGNWNGARPIIEAFAGLERKLEIANNRISFEIGVSEDLERQLGEVRGVLDAMYDEYMKDEACDHTVINRLIEEAHAALGASCTESGGTASPKSDGLCKSEGWDAAEFDHWFQVVRDWSGSALVADEKIPARLRREHLLALYGDLCSLGNYLAAWADMARHVTDDGSPLEGE
jgi:hypothetical protein